MRSAFLPVPSTRLEPARNVAAVNANSQLGLDLFQQEIAAEAIRSGRRLVCAEDQPPTFRLSVSNGFYVFETWLPGERFPPRGEDFPPPNSADLLVLW